MTVKNSRLILLFFVTCVVLIPGTSAWAQRTGDHIVPSIETVCDDDPFSFGLCNAYCEALDCDSDTPIGSPRACGRVLSNYMRKSAGVAPPCEATCPCDFDVSSDMAGLATAFQSNQGYITDPATREAFCDLLGPNGEDAFVSQEFEFPPGGLNTPQGIRLVYWLEAAANSDPPRCHEVGGGTDGADPEDNGGLLGETWTYGPYFERSEALIGAEEAACQQALEQLCASID